MKMDRADSRRTLVPTGPLLVLLSSAAAACSVSLERGGPESDGEGGAATVVSSSQVGSTSTSSGDGTGGVGDGGNGGHGGGAGGGGSSVVSSSSGGPCGGLNEPCCAGDACNDERHACDEDTGTCRGCVVALASGNSAAGACLRNKRGQTLCWGHNDDSELDCIANVNAYLPRTVDGLELVDVRQISDHICALGPGDTIFCRGLNSSGQCGEEATSNPTCPVHVVDLSDAREVTVTGSGSTIALTTSGKVYGWGDNSFGQLGDVLDDEEDPEELVVLGATNVGVAATSQSTCSLDANGDVRCVGFNQYYELGVAGPPGTGTPNVANVDELVAGSHFYCARTGGQIRCWGDNTYGQIDPDDATSPLADPRVIDLPGNATQISAGGGHACAVIEGGSVYCWGHNDRGQVGTCGVDYLPPLQVYLDEDRSVLAAKKVVAGSQSTCVIDVDDDVWCWGSNDFYQLGIDNGFNDECLPKRVKLSCE